jgi:hypothetical protein
MISRFKPFPTSILDLIRCGERRPKRFNVDSFWDREDWDAIFHLHGSVHMGFPHPGGGGGEIGELFWFDDRADALKYSSFYGSDERRMDGGSVIRTAIITGLDKLSRLQQRPLSHFYSVLARDMMLADVIYVIGSGLSDLHVNTWLKEARSRNPMPPILFIDRTTIDPGRKGIEMFHALKIHISHEYPGTKVGTGWIVSNDQTSAVWGEGFPGARATCR